MRKNSQLGKTKGMSPYTKYAKRPFRYSENYQLWRKAVLARDEKATAFYSRKHSLQFGLAFNI